MSVIKEAALPNLLELTRLGIPDNVGVLAVTTGLAVITEGLGSELLVRKLNVLQEAPDDVHRLVVLNRSNEFPVSDLGQSLGFDLNI